jgi:quinol-cytochrome oxidoreductase complex cytochrome b subunit
MTYYGYVPSALHAPKTAAEIAMAGNSNGIRSVHSLAADAFLIFIFFHVARIAMTRSHYGERKITWFTGIALLALAGLFFYTGTMLKLDQAGHEAYEQIGNFVPINQIWFRGVHVVLLPIILGGVLGRHMLLIKIKKISPLAPGVVDKGPQATFFRHTAHVVAYGLIVVGAIHVIAAYYAPPLLAEPVEGVRWTKPSWPFLFLYPFGSWAVVAFPIFALVGLFVLPFFVNPQKRWDISHAIFFLLAACWAGLSIYGALMRNV